MAFSKNLEGKVISSNILTNIKNSMQTTQFYKVSNSDTSDTVSNVF